MKTNVKRKLSDLVKLSVELNEEQNAAYNVILQNKITVLKGSAGSGKSMLAAYAALNLLFSKEYDKIIITRPTVTAGEDQGWLPGNIDAKLAPYTAALYDNMTRLYDSMKIESLIQEGKIEVIPLGFMRGRNMMDCVVVVDEAQNITDKQMELMLGRLCGGAKMILCGDSRQCDLKSQKESGFDFLCYQLKDVEGIEVVTLLQNHRDPIVERILEIYENRK